MQKLTQKRAGELLSYDETTGVLTWRISRGRMKAGSIAGTINGNGYLHVFIDGTGYLAHRVIWLMVTGNWPTLVVDHINHKKTDNRWVNLREVTISENLKNRPMQRNNSSGHTGVCWREAYGVWEAKIRVGGQTIYIGEFKKKSEAIDARRAAEKHYGFHENHGKHSG